MIRQCFVLAKCLVVSRTIPLWLLLLGEEFDEFMRMDERFAILYLEGVAGLMDHHQGMERN